jgi:uncharacterized RDD family membrane protein YckC
MRCPKCGYNSFDHLTTCKKCGRDLVEFKQRFGIKSMLFPGRAIESEEHDEAISDAAVEDLTTAVPEAVIVAEVTAGGADDFGFDFMDDSAEDDDLSFDELFEAAAEEEDVDETLEGPKAEAEDGTVELELPEEDELKDDFGFDVDEVDLASTEDRKDPFELPESSQNAGAPEFADKRVQIFDPEEVDAESILSQELGFPVLATDSENVDVLLEHPVVKELSETEFAVDNADIFLFKSEPEPEPVPESFGVAEFAPLSDEEADRGPWPLPLSPDEIPSVGSRVFAFAYDLVLLLLILVAFIVGAEAATASRSVRLIPSLETFVALSIPYFLMIFVLVFGYFTLFHFLTGQTLGKMLTGLRVESLEREPLTIVQAFLRSVGGLIQLVPVGLGFLSVLLYPQQRGLSDRLAGTLVVNLKATPENPHFP